MQKVFRIIGLVALGWGAVLGSAMALPAALELGSVDLGNPASPTIETSYLSALVLGYNNSLAGKATGLSAVYKLAPAAGVPTTLLPATGVNNGQVVIMNGPQTGLQINLGGGGYNYVMVKWGAEDEFYYIGGLSGTIVINNDIDGSNESHYDLFGTQQVQTEGTVATVPDNGATVGLLGFALIGLAWFSRMFRPVTVRS